MDSYMKKKPNKSRFKELIQHIFPFCRPFPEELNKIFSKWMELCEDQGKEEIGQRLISASLFLRFLCPAILSPSLFGLTQSYPEPNILRTLTLTAKVIQNLANFTLWVSFSHLRSHRQACFKKQQLHFATKQRRCYGAFSYLSRQVRRFRNITIKLGSTNGMIFSPSHASMAHLKDAMWWQYYADMLPVFGNKLQTKWEIKHWSKWNYLCEFRFGEKEEYMLFMNEFLQQHWDGMRSFLKTVSNQDTEIPMPSFDGYVDLPLRLAVLHGLLVDIIYKKDQVGKNMTSV